MLHLRLEEAHSAVHLVEAADVRDKGALERCDVWIELWQRRERKISDTVRNGRRPLVARTHILEHDVSELSELSDGSMSRLGGHVNLD